MIPFDSKLGGNLFGQPIYKKASEIPDTIEGAVISISAKFTVDALKQCLERGAKWVTIVPGGFKETGTKEGIEAEVWMNGEAQIVGGYPSFGRRIQVSYCGS